VIIYRKFVHSSFFFSNLDKVLYDFDRDSFDIYKSIEAKIKMFKRNFKIGIPKFHSVFFNQFIIFGISIQYFFYERFHKYY